MKKVIAYQTLLIAAPIVALVVGGVVWMNQQRRLTRIKAEGEVVLKEVRTVQAQLKLADSQQASKRFPTVELNAQEQSKFLDLLRLCALETGVEITSWKNAVAGGDATPGSSNTGAATAKPASTAPRKLPEGISMVTSNVEVRGAFPKVRDFLYRLQLNPRLLSIHKARWGRDAKYPNTVAEFTLSRYVHLASANPEIAVDAVPAVPAVPAVHHDDEHHDDEHEHHHEETKP